VSDDKPIDLTLYYGTTTNQPGRIIANEEIEEFTQMTIGKKLEFIRTELNKIYPGEYTWRRVSSKANISYQGLRDIENEDSIPREDTVEILANHYDALMTWFSQEDLKNIEGFYLAKKDDREAFFFWYSAEHDWFHDLDPRSKKPRKSEEELNDEWAKEYELDDFGFPIIKGDEEWIPDSISLEIRLEAIGTKSEDLIKRITIKEHSMLTLHDLDHIEDMIRREIRYLTERNSKHEQIVSEWVRLSLSHGEISEEDS
jgi:hypothetical protein